MANSEPDYWDIDPYEKDWMLANAESKMETIHRLFMTEPSLVNRRDFVHGYTAMHWAAKHGRCDLISALVMNGAVVNLKSVSVCVCVCARMHKCYTVHVVYCFPNPFPTHCLTPWLLTA